ncbi:hypothetical protein EV356DRAFT_500541 [Viridothelium virens]|uniref:Rrn9 domain-containing protein n=1 Tax=Viridothelium virens TaxID=1048519 RepID=A0A6A6HBT4_VIRVR|nr:hypothetical protein EV356DRAFT_500541 [Viridothelium virens]
MSLFGGDSAASRNTIPALSQSSSDDEDAIPTSAQQSSKPSRPAIRQSNNLDSNEVPLSPSPLLDSTASPDAEVSDGASSSSSSSSSFSLLPRPNRYTGPQPSWFFITQRERSLIASLEQERANDLSMHLYNAHALKARMRTQDRVARSKSWTSRHQWMDVGKEKGKKFQKWHPRAEWTAWPLVPERVPRRDEVWGMAGDDGNDAFTLKREEEKASELMEDVLIGVIMGQAREQWDAREWEDEDEDDEEETAKGGRSRKRVKREDGKASDGAELEPDPMESPSRSRPESPLEQSNKPTIKAMEGDAETNLMDGSVREHHSRPVFMANEEQERLILKPIVRSLLADLDALLGALHYTAPDNTSTAKDTFPKYDPPAHGHQANADARGPLMKDQFSKRPGIGKDSTFVRDPQELSKQDTVPEDEIDSNSSTSDSEMPGDFIEPAPSAPQKKTQPETGKGLRDWSEILNAASTIGWNRQVIHRAAQRCTALFGETMSFRILKEEDAQIPVGAPIQYTPEIIPPLPQCDDGATPELIRWDGESRRCPFPTCPDGKHDQPLSDIKSLDRHLLRVHNYDHWEDKRVGAVHNDGFLQPIPKQRVNPRRRRIPPSVKDILDFRDPQHPRSSSKNTSRKRKKKAMDASRDNGTEAGRAEVKNGEDSRLDNGQVAEENVHDDEEVVNRDDR